MLHWILGQEHLYSFPPIPTDSLHAGERFPVKGLPSIELSVREKNQLLLDVG